MQLCVLSARGSFQRASIRNQGRQQWSSAHGPPPAPARPAATVESRSFDSSQEDFRDIGRRDSRSPQREGRSRSTRPPSHHRNRRTQGREGVASARGGKGTSRGDEPQRGRRPGTARGAKASPERSLRSVAAAADKAGPPRSLGELPDPPAPRARGKSRSRRRALVADSDLSREEDAQYIVGWFSIQDRTGNEVTALREEDISVSEEAVESEWQPDKIECVTEDYQVYSLTENGWKLLDSQGTVAQDRRRRLDCRVGAGAGGGAMQGKNRSQALGAAGAPFAVGGDYGPSKVVVPRLKGSREAGQGVGGAAAERMTPPSWGPNGRAGSGGSAGPSGTAGVPSGTGLGSRADAAFPRAPHAVTVVGSKHRAPLPAGTPTALQAQAQQKRIRKQGFPGRAQGPSTGMLSFADEDADMAEEDGRGAGPPPPPLRLGSLPRATPERPGGEGGRSGSGTMAPQGRTVQPGAGLARGVGVAPPPGWTGVRSTGAGVGGSTTRRPAAAPYAAGTGSKAVANTPVPAPSRGRYNQWSVVDDDASTGSVATEPGERSDCRVVVGAHRLKGARPYMEDRHVVVVGLGPGQTEPATSSARLSPLPGIGSQGPTTADAEAGAGPIYIGVFDGHNGAQCADRANADLHRHLVSHPGYTRDPLEPATDFLAYAQLRKQDSSSPMYSDPRVQAFKHAFAETDRAILRDCELLGYKGGSTALCVLKEGPLLYVAHAGDSRAVLGRRGKALRLTEDHKPSVPREKQRIASQGGLVELIGCWRVLIANPSQGQVLSGLAVSRSLGDAEFKEPRRLVSADPDVSRVHLRPGDQVVVLGTDGLWDVVSDQEAVQITVKAIRDFMRARSALSSRAAGPPTPRRGLRGTVGALGMSGRLDGLSTLPAVPGTPGSPVGQGRLGSSDPWESNTPIPEAAAQNAARTLAERAIAGGSMDNVTVVVMALQWQ